MLETGRICRVAVDEKGSLLGIIGGIPGYDGMSGNYTHSLCSLSCRDKDRPKVGGGF